MCAFQVFSPVRAAEAASPGAAAATAAAPAVPHVAELHPCNYSIRHRPHTLITAAQSIKN